jgi:hypothetical protein
MSVNLNVDVYAGCLQIVCSCAPIMPSEAQGHPQVLGWDLCEREGQYRITAVRSEVLGGN